MRRDIGRDPPTPNHAQGGESLPLSAVQRIGIAGLRAFARLFARRIHLRTEGTHNVPETGPVVLAARHYHHVYDGVALLAATPRPVHLVISIDWVRSRARRVALHGLAYVAAWPVLLRTERVALPDAAPASRSVFSPEDVRPYKLHCLRQCAALLHDGRVIVMFPEGYPNIDPHDSPKTKPDEFLPFRPGFARMAQAAARRAGQPIPVVPVGFVYSAKPRWNVLMRFGAPLDVVPSDETEPVVAEIESRVRALCSSTPGGFQTSTH